MGKRSPKKYVKPKSKTRVKRKYENILFQVLSTGEIRSELAVFYTFLAQHGAMVSVFMGHSGYMASDRNDAINNWLASGEHDYLVQCDQDMVPPVDVLKLASHGKDLVGCSYLCGSDRGPLLAAGPRVDNGEISFPKQDPGESDIIEVEWVGTGCYAISRDAALRMKAVQNGRVFDFDFGPNGEKKTGVDILLSRRMREIGLKVWLDRGIVAGHAKAMTWAPSLEGKLRCLPWGTYWKGDEVPHSVEDRKKLSDLLDFV